MYIGIKIQIYPNKEQEKYLFHCCEAQHKLRNFLVAKYKDNLPKIISNTGIKGYNDLDLQNEYPIENIPKRIYRSAICNYAISMKRFYQELGRPPKFHKFNYNKQSFSIVDIVFNIKNYEINLPSYIGMNINKKIILNKDVINKYNITQIKNVTYTYYKNKWYLSGVYEVVDIPIIKNKTYIGLDWGIKNFMTSNDGMIFNYPSTILHQFNRIKKLQHYLDKKQKGSNNYNRLLLKIQKAYARINNIKRNYIEQTTTSIAKNNHVVIEDIDMQQFMIKKENNKFIRQKSIISPYYPFIENMEWKCKKFGSKFIKVTPNDTTRICSVCGYIAPRLPLNERVFKCPKCKTTIDRDINAAINIKKRGMI